FVLGGLDGVAQALGRLLFPVVAALTRAVEEQDGRVGLLGVVALGDVHHVLHGGAVDVDRLVQEAGFGSRGAGEQRQDQQGRFHGVLLYRGITIIERRIPVPRFEGSVRRAAPLFPRNPGPFGYNATVHRGDHGKGNRLLRRLREKTVRRRL